ncbi:UDP-N-acetylmuramoyl-L-alanyl-D-glutamate--2,6-diaminopimelate ligase [Planomicrobium sp. YIM 101495]|uniref:UDP-N-acetylmuramoyl-L-alanyl-D-glutamate--2, 6-diaminopimelate ligase n=1 Tax=Planomicrobium sp. YIM 101495 TaxID=2665160 RepID=UPI0012B767B8|nr:UDP-N-acetylmuramoyl-L-alanyl-D-glutamate--2,6-diaminopimelate ligase [Planomicrobium sp. YIM 101495]MTD30424.1 UDP-N-acetylmuramoyl-L-alanyl-D-glutamate--2,6-diaminopimelate ligase [Planomicrobium sp. YIM 101495]
MDTKQLLQHIAIKQLIGTLPETIETMTMDSREAKSGALFVCIPGYTVDGHDFAGVAVERGAGVIVAERELALPEHVAQIIVTDSSRALGQLAAAFYNHPSKEMQMIGVTGTNGKTSVGGIIHALLMELGKKSALSGTIGFNINGNLEASANTTNDALTTQGMIHRAKNEGCSHMSMEVSSHGLVLGRLAGVEFNTAIFTNLTHDHLDFHGTMEEYGHAKGLLFSQLGQNLAEQKQSILNADDPWSERYAQMTPHRVFTYGIEQPADFKASVIEMDGAGTHYTMTCAEGEFHVSMKLLGAFNVANTLAAIAALSAEGIPITDILAALAVIEPIDGRMQKVETDLPISIFIDYAHTPDAIEKAIEAVEPFKTNKVIFLVGTGGNRDKTKRPTMAAKASKADYVVLTTDDPRDEAYDSIVNDLEKGMTHGAYACIGDREEAVRHAVQQAEPGDLLIFAGKGHEDFQIIGNTKYPHSDKDIAIDEAKKKFNLN